METTITISDFNAGTYVFTNTTAEGLNSVTYAVVDDITLTN
jgi:hypothetical protein